MSTCSGEEHDLSTQLSRNSSLSQRVRSFPQNWFCLEIYNPVFFCQITQNATEVAKPQWSVLEVIHVLALTNVPHFPAPKTH